jgi:hypothetical protein
MIQQKEHNTHNILRPSSGVDGKTPLKDKDLML